MATRLRFGTASRAPALGLAALLLALACSGGGPGPPATLTDLASLQDLQTAFNRDAGVPRIVLLVSPT